MVATDANGGNVSRLFPIANDTHGSLDYSGFVTAGADRVLFCAPLSDTVYEVTKKLTIAPRYAFDFGEKKLPTPIRNSHEAFIKEEANYYYLLNPFFEANDILAFSYARGNRIVNAFCDSSQEADTDGRLEAVQFAFPFNREVVGVTDDSKFIAAIPAIFTAWLDEGAISADELRVQAPELLEMAATMDDMANPVLAIYELKGI